VGRGRRSASLLCARGGESRSGSVIELGNETRDLGRVVNQIESERDRDLGRVVTT